MVICNLAMPESFPVFVNLSIIVAFAVTARDDEIFSNYCGMPLGACRIILASVEPPISCSFSMDPLEVAVITKSGIRKGFISPPFLSCIPRNTCRLL